MPTRIAMRHTSAQPPRSTRSKRVSKWLLPIVAILGVIGLTAPAWGHHSPFVFAQQKEVTLSGTVKAFDYTNPHVWLRLMVPGENGNAVQWNIETGSPIALKRAGIERTTFRPGESVTVRVHPFSKTRPEASAWLVDVTKADGRKFDVG